MSFELATATRVAFGPGSAAQVPEALRGMGARRALLVTGKGADRAAALREAVEKGGVALVPFAVAGEPTLDVARAGTALAVGERCDAVLAIGGGSALDCAKAVAALATNRGDPLDYLEVVGRGLALARPSLPFVAVPSTAGTGSEVTRNAVLTDPTTRVKASLRSAHMLPRLAVVDPDLLRGASADLVAGCGLDALAQNVEPFLSGRANPITDALAREGIRRSARSLRRVVEAGVDQVALEAREDLALTSLCGGLCLANAGLGAVHGFAAPVGGMFAAPHGAVCGALLAPVLEVNLRALRERAPAHPALERMRELAVLLTGRGHASAEEGVTWVRELVRALGVPGLARWGVKEADVPALVERAKEASSMKGNPIPLEDAELARIALQAIQTA